MKTIYEKAKENPLFRGVLEEEFQKVIQCVEGRVLSYTKNAVIQLAGAPVKTIGLVLSGCVQVLQEDPGGRQNLMAEICPGELFGEVFACVGLLHSPVTVMASEPSQVLHLNFRKLIATCPSSCAFHHRLIENMLALVAEKNLLLQQKNEILSKRTTRERLLLYLNRHRQGEQPFTIPFSREELAAYLCVDRSAMSAELSKMQREGLIRYHRNSFLIG